PFCLECGEPIPERRRTALPGVKTCVACQSSRDRKVAHSTINRRGSKDSQLR
ncbi:MAG TPA: TraR/DksA C4-type zinc finger protein, partial [Qipengyuania sp.]|nr:TraR/DksA C4-type zinc finger protein [Qipengyuania sp.]